MAALIDYILKIEKVTITAGTEQIPVVCVRVSDDMPSTVDVDRLALGGLIASSITGVVACGMWCNADMAGAFPASLSNTNEDLVIAGVSGQWRRQYVYDESLTTPRWKYAYFRLDWRPVADSGIFEMITEGPEYSGYGDITVQPAILFVRGATGYDIISTSNSWANYITFESSSDSAYLGSITPKIPATILSTLALKNPQTNAQVVAATFMASGDISDMVVVETDDPYKPGGNTEPSGPNTGTWTIVNNDIDFPALPTITASDSGFFSLWVPTLEQIQLLAGFMWNTDVLNIDFWKRMVTSPLELILGLSLFPLDLDVDGHESLTLGLVDTRIDTNYRDAQFVDVDCGELDLEEYYGAFLDYAPFTQLDIYLPYIGVRTINTNDVMPKRLHLRYRIDLVSGSCVAMLKADGSVFYHWTGSCSVQIPVTTQQMQSLVSGAISAGGAVAGGILTGGIAGALAATTGVASAAANSSQQVGRSGMMGSAAGFLGVQTPYLIITRPRQAIPEDQTRYTGYPTFITAKLGDLTGYTEIEAVHLHDIPATSDELDEIERLLGEGVIL